MKDSQFAILVAGLIIFTMWMVSRSSWDLPMNTIYWDMKSKCYGEVVIKENVGEEGNQFISLECQEATRSGELK